MRPTTPAGAGHTPPGRPLAGIHIAVTRPARQSDALRQSLESLGADVTVIPVTRIELLDPAPIREVLPRLDGYDWVVFTSVNAVEAVLGELSALGGGASALAGRRVAAVGPATAAALESAGVTVTLVPDRHRAEGLVDALATEQMRGMRVLHPAAEEGSSVLAHGLAAAGALVDTVAVYRTIPDRSAAAALGPRVASGDIVVVVFAAPSAVRVVADVLGDAISLIRAVSIGPVTSDALREAGFSVAAESRSATPDAIAEAVRRATNR